MWLHVACPGRRPSCVTAGVCVVRLEEEAGEYSMIVSLILSLVDVDGRMLVLVVRMQEDEPEEAAGGTRRPHWEGKPHNGRSFLHLGRPVEGSSSPETHLQFTGRQSHANNQKTANGGFQVRKFRQMPLR